MLSFVLVKPGNPTLTLHPDLLEGQNEESHYCTGEVGQPPGNLEIQIKRSSDSDFTRYRPPNQKTTLSLVNSENCSSVTKLTFSVDLTSDSWTNVTVRCVVSGLASNHTLGPQYSSSEYIVSGIPSKYYTKHCKNIPSIFLPTYLVHGSHENLNSLCIYLFLKILL